MKRAFLPLVLAAILATPAFGAGVRSPGEVRPRVDHHLRHAEDLAQHFESVLGTSCPSFGSTGEWDGYLEHEVDRVVLLMAHVEQAWVEAKTTGDDEIRRAAKAPRRRLTQARDLLDKLTECAQRHGAPLDQLALWRRIEREVPQRQAEIALPQ